MYVGKKKGQEVPFNVKSTTGLFLVPLCMQNNVNIICHLDTM